MKKSALAVILLFAGGLACFGQTLRGALVTDPVAHFCSVYEMGIVRKIYRLEADLNHDGKKEVLVGHIDLDPDTLRETDENEVGWWVYVAQANGRYVLAGRKDDTGGVSNAAAGFSKNQYWIGLIPELNRYGLLYLSSGTGGQALCQLMAIVLEQNDFKVLEIGQPVSAELNYDQLAKRFANPPTPLLQEIAP